MPYLSPRGIKKPIAEINVVPFIDVMLVLLVIFMITTPLLTQGVKVNLPKVANQSIPPQQKQPIIVTVDGHGNLYLNIAEKPNQPITTRTLNYLVANQLKNVSAENQRPVLIRGDKNTNYGKVVEVMSLLQQAGAKSVGMVTEPNKIAQG